jgi:dephospho-CoA kinase
LAEKTYLETLLHPFIWDALKQRAKTAKSPYVILEIPLLFETTIETRKPDYIDRILVIDTLVENQIQRVKTRDKLSEEQIQEILKHQVSREYRLNHADDIIFNDGDLDHLHDQVAMCHARYLEMCTFP